MMNPLHGKTIAITGGAGGIGREIARVLARGGASVAIGDLDAEAAAAVAAALPTAGGGSLTAPTHVGLGIDVTDDDSTDAFLAGVTAELGPVDVLILAAGVMWVGPYDDEPATTADAQVGINLLGVIRGIKAAAPAMAERGAGHIITIASAASLLGPRGRQPTRRPSTGFWGTSRPCGRSCAERVCRSAR